MHKLFYFEIRKNYLRKYLLIAVVVLFIINLSFIYNKYIFGFDSSGYFMPHTDKTLKRWEFYINMHKKLDGVLTNSKAQFIVDENKRVASIVSDGTYSKEYQSDTYTGYYWSDYVMVSKYFYNPMKYLSMYSINNDKIVKQAEDNIKFYDKYNNKYEKEKYKFIVNNYKGRKITLFYDTKPWEALFDYNFSDLIIMFLMLLGIVPVFVSEKETNMQNLIMSSKKGKKSTVFVKVLATLVYITFLVCIFSAFNILFFKCLYGLNGAEMPIYAMEKYQYTPLGYSMGTFYFITQLFKIGGLFCFAMFILLLSSLFNRIIYPYMISAFIMVGGIYVSGYIDSIELGKTVMSIISPFTLLKGNEFYIKPLGINILNKFYLRAEICMIVQVLIICVSYIIIHKITARSSILSNKEFSSQVEVII